MATSRFCEYWWSMSNPGKRWNNVDTPKGGASWSLETAAYDSTATAAKCLLVAHLHFAELWQETSWRNFQESRELRLTFRGHPLTLDYKGRVSRSEHGHTGCQATAWQRELGNRPGTNMWISNSQNGLVLWKRGKWFSIPVSTSCRAHPQCYPSEWIWS